jgi:two-component system chemotaxis response regulator CheY
MEQTPARSLQKTIEAMKVLVVDDEQHMRKVVRTMLLAIGVRTVYEADDGQAGLEAICRHKPDMVVVDWEMPGMDGSTFVRMVRSPKEFPFPDVPIIMLSGHGDRWRVVEAAKLGAHEYLLKPVSTKALYERIAAILTVPRPFITEVLQSRRGASGVGAEARQAPEGCRARRQSPGGGFALASGPSAGTRRPRRSRREKGRPPVN